MTNMDSMKNGNNHNHNQNGIEKEHRHDKLPVWRYEGPHLTLEELAEAKATATTDGNNYDQLQSLKSLLPLEGPFSLQLGSYCRAASVSNVGDPKGRAYFDLGLRLMMSYQHEIASKCFLTCLEYSPDCALAHGFMALCHSPNYNFRGDAYYLSASHLEDVNQEDLLCLFPSQQVADRHARQAMEIVERLRRQQRRNGNGSGGGNGYSNGKRGGKAGKKSQHRKAASNGTTDQQQQEQQQQLAVDANGSTVISDPETQLLAAIRVLTSCPGVDASLSEETVGRPYANAMRKVHAKYPHDPEIAYCFAESLMVLNAWQLYEYPSGKPVGPDVVETRRVLEEALVLHPRHPGLCHLYVHLSEMSAHPEQALKACEPLRQDLPHAGHLIHMPTHIDVLVGDYESCLKYNLKALEADRQVMKASPSTAGLTSFYYGYIVHDAHMAVYGCILGAMEGKAMEVAGELNAMVNETLFQKHPELTSYLESYSALEIHVLIRFGRWKQLLEMDPPKDKQLMLYRTASLLFGKALAWAALGDTVQAQKEADRLDSLLQVHHQAASERILHNNTVADLLAVDVVMMRGEIAYRQGKYDEAFTLLRKAVDMQDNLNYDEPWGIMQPIRHALGGLLLEQNHLEEAAAVFRKDLIYHPKNPWALTGLLQCLKKRATNTKCCSASPTPSPKSPGDIAAEIQELEDLLQKIRKNNPYADYDVNVACECCQHSKS